MELSIVTTMYRSAPYLDEFYSRIAKEAGKITGSYEIIFVNDGSPDDSLETALHLRSKDRRVRVVDLSRNFGHHKAMMTGLSYARGELVFLIDCDLEEEPELLGQFYGTFRESGCDVVYGVQNARRGGLFERLSGEVFYAVLDAMSSARIPRNMVTARLMSSRYVKSLLMHRESELFIAGLWHITGYKQQALPVTKHSKGESSYSIGKKLALSVNAITSFSDKPLIYIFYSGAAISVLSIAYMLKIVVDKLFFNVDVSGWSSLIVSIWLLGGITIFFLGVIGIYLSKVFIETKNRPYAIVRAVYGGESDERKEV